MWPCLYSGQPVTMLLTNAKERKDRVITSNIGRTLKTVPGEREIAFERREEDGSNAIYVLSPDSDEFDKLIAKLKTQVIG